MTSEPVRRSEEPLSCGTASKHGSGPSPGGRVTGHQAGIYFAVSLLIEQLAS